MQRQFCSLQLCCVPFEDGLLQSSIAGMPCNLFQNSSLISSLPSLKRHSYKRVIKHRHYWC